MITRILFATDFSRWTRRAEDYACALACSWRASLTVLSVAEFPPGLNPRYPVNQQYLADLLKHASSQLVDLKGRAERRGIAVTTRMATGIPSEEVITAARAEDSDLLVVGTRGKTGLAHVLLGSTAERVIRGAPCPVLTVRHPEHEFVLPDALVAVAPWVREELLAIADRLVVRVHFPSQIAFPAVLQSRAKIDERGL